jgi:hypothetical protein
MRWVSGFLRSLSFLTVASAQTVWQIGKFDRSPLEFGSGAQNNLTYAVEKNDWKTNWPGRQDIKQPYRITFSLNSLQGVYVLKISTLCSSTM